MVVDSNSNKQIDPCISLFVASPVRISLLTTRYKDRKSLTEGGDTIRGGLHAATPKV